MRTFDLDDLAIFRTVVQAGGVVRAAEQLHRVPSNVTTRIRQLEQRLQVKLFRRQGRGLELSAAGVRLLAHAQGLLQMADAAEQDMAGGAVRGLLRLGSLESAAGVRLPAVLARFHAQHPDVAIELRTGTTAALLHLLERFEVEAAFISEPFDAPGLQTRPAFQEELVLVTAKGEAPVRRAADLNGRTLVVFPHGCSYRRRLSDWLAEDGAAPGRFIDIASYHAIVACVAAGTGAAIVPAEVLDHAVPGHGVQRHRLPRHVRTNRTHLAWRGDPSASLRALMALLPRARAGKGS